MMSRRKVAVSLLAVSLTAAAFLIPTLAVAAKAEARQFIETMAQKAIATLTDKDLPRAERIQNFRNILNDHFAVPEIGRWVLGRYWNRASSDEKAEYLALFEDLIVVTYVDRFAEYAGEQLIIDGTEELGAADNLVRSRIQRPGDAKPVRVDWRVRNAGNGGHRIYDVIVEGVSMAQTQRSEFGSVISRQGRTVAGLLKVLREKTESLQSQN